MPTLLHQLVVGAICSLLKSWAARNGGLAVQAPMPLRIKAEKYREPDVLFLLDPSRHAPDKSFVSSADLVVEVVSEGKKSRERDYVEKCRDYAKAGIKEYWIVDPLEKRATVMMLKGAKYIEHSAASAGGVIESALLEGLTVPVSSLLEFKK